MATSTTTSYLLPPVRRALFLGHDKAPHHTPACVRGVSLDWNVPMPAHMVYCRRCHRFWDAALFEIDCCRECCAKSQ